MKNETQELLNPTDARNAGALYLTIAVFGAFSIGYVPSQIVAADGATSAANLMAHPILFRLGVLADSAVILLELAITVILFRMFQATSPRLAILAMLSRAGMIMVMGINLLLWVLPYLLLTRSMGFSEDDAHALSQLFFEAHALGVFVWQLFFGAHLIALGLIILRSRPVPHILGWGLLVGAFGYLIQGLAKLTFTDVFVLDIVIIGLLVIVSVSEISFGIWLLIWGRRNAKHQPMSSPQTA